jgi:hypothetical protein
VGGIHRGRHWQDELIRRVLAVNPRTVVVGDAGAPVLLPWADDVPAVLLAWFPGQEFGNALPDVFARRRRARRADAGELARGRGWPAFHPTGERRGFLRRMLFVG